MYVDVPGVHWYWAKHYYIGIWGNNRTHNYEFKRWSVTWPVPQTNLTVQVLLWREHDVVVQQLQSLLQVVVTKVLRGGATSATTRCGVLEAGGIKNENGRHSTDVWRQRPGTQWFTYNTCLCCYKITITHPRNNKGYRLLSLWKFHIKRRVSVCRILFILKCNVLKSIINMLKVYSPYVYPSQCLHLKDTTSGAQMVNNTSSLKNKFYWHYQYVA